MIDASEQRTLPVDTEHAGELLPQIPGSEEPHSPASSALEVIAVKVRLCHRDEPDPRRQKRSIHSLADGDDGICIHHLKHLSAVGHEDEVQGNGVGT